MARTYLLLGAVAALLGGCGTLPDGREWGRDATLAPGWERVRSAAAAAASDPGTWAPAAGAGLLLVTGTDRRLSDWAIEQKPLFGEDAGRTTDRLRNTADAMALGTALLTPSGSDPGRWAGNKLRGIGVEALAGVVANNLTGVIKGTVRREEPTGSEARYESFVSAHATVPFADAALVRRNSERLDWPRWGRNVLTSTAAVTAAGSAWGRVEMGLHYPSDQLAGAAIGNFIGLFVHDLFMGLDDAARFHVGLVPGGATLSWETRY